MNPHTGRIELVATDEDKRDAERRGLIPLSHRQLSKVAPMNRAQRKAWAKKHLSRAQRMR